MSTPTPTATPTPTPSTPPPTTPLTPQEEEREFQRIRQLAKDSFWQIVWDEWPNVREACGKAWEDPVLSRQCQTERSIIREHVEVFEHGVLLSLVVFAALRLTAHPQFERVASQYIKPFFSLPKLNGKNKRGGTPSTPTKNTTKQEQAPQQYRQFKSFLEHKRDTHVQKVHQAAEAPHDFLVGTIVGLSATLFFFRPNQLRLDWEEAPLMDGHSYLCQHMCPKFIHAYQQTDPQVFVFDDKNKDATLESFQQFAVHCILRAAHIQKRQQQGYEKPNVLPESGPWEENGEGDDGGIIVVDSGNDEKQHNKLAT